MKILITGSTGFIGSRISAALKKEGRHDIIGIDTREEPTYKIDVSDYATFSKFLKETKPDAIVHCAAIKDLESCEENKEVAFKTNVLSTETIVNYTLENSPKCKVIYISSDVVFDGESGNYKINSRTNPINWYGKTKAFSEILLRNLKSFAIYRTSLVIGPLDTQYKALLQKELDSDKLQNQTLLPHYIYNRLKNNREIYLPKDVISNPTPIDLITYAIKKSLTNFKPGVFHLAGPEQFSRFNFATRIADYFSLDKDLIIPDKRGISNIRPLNISLDVDETFEILEIDKTNWSFEEYIKFINHEDLT